MAFGAVYPWAMWPLAAAELGLGVVICARRAPAPGERPLVVALLLVFAAIVAQLLPLSPPTIRAVAPAADRVLLQQDLGYALIGRAHALSIDPPSTLRALLLYVPLAVLLIGLRRALARDTAERLAAGLAVFASGLAAVGILQFLTYNGKVLWFWTPVSGGYRPFGPFVNRNSFAGWMAMALPIVIGLLFARVSKASRGASPTLRARVLWLFSNETSKTMVFVLAVLLATCSVVLTMSRSGIAATGVALALAVIFAMKPLGAARRAIAAGCIVLAGTLAVALAGPADLAARFSEAWLPSRLGIWRDTLDIARDFAPFGSGINTFTTAALFYQHVLPDNSFTAAHNDYLQLAADGGLLVGVPAVLVLALLAADARQRLRQSTGTSYWLRAGAVTGLVAIALQSLVDFSLQIPGNAALCTILVALATYPDAAGTRRGP